MKAVYINLDPYLQAFADWLNAGKPGDAPKFDPLPLAVTIPLGQDVVLLSQGDIYTGDTNVYTVDGQSVWAGFTSATGVVNPGDEDSAIARHFSRFVASVEKYYPIQLTSDSPTLSIAISEAGGDNASVVTFAVLVRREPASGPVDLVDFTPPAAAPSAADIKSALAAAGNGALEGVDLGGAILRRKPDEGSDIPTMVDNAGPLASAADDVLKIGSASA